jgi:hypothetical protein
MKTTFLFLALFTGISLGSCSKENAIDLQETYPFQFKGLVKKQMVTTYMYGTHTITEEGKTYALKSSTVNLDQYVDKTVTVKGNKIDGYPVDNGPEYIDVKAVE